MDGRRLGVEAAALGGYGTLITTPFVGEIAWQQAGSPGRETFPPLEHLGNFAPGMTMAALSFVVITASAGRYYDSLASRGLASESEVTALKQSTDRAFMAVSLGITSLAQIYSETVDTGTHDPLDIVAGVVGAATGVGGIAGIRRLKAHAMERYRSPTEQPPRNHRRHRGNR